MNITKCDICKKIIRREDKSVDITLDGFSGGHFELCRDCSQPVMKFLKSKLLIKDEVVKKK